MLVSEYFTKGEDIVVKGDQASSYKIIKKGEISVIVEDAEGVSKEVNTLKEGMYFGE